MTARRAQEGTSLIPDDRPEAEGWPAAGKAVETRYTGCDASSSTLRT